MYRFADSVDLRADHKVILQPSFIVPKPRMTQKDKFNPSKAVQRYLDYKDEITMLLTIQKAVIPIPYLIAFFLPMPDKWSKAVKEENRGKYHNQVPDKDNLEKAFLDVITTDDSFVSDGRPIKYWWDTPLIVIRPLPPIAACQVLDDREFYFTLPE